MQRLCLESRTSHHPGYYGAKDAEGELSEAALQGQQPHILENIRSRKGAKTSNCSKKRGMVSPHFIVEAGFGGVRPRQEAHVHTDRFEQYFRLS